MQRLYNSKQTNVLKIRTKSRRGEIIISSTNNSTRRDGLLTKDSKKISILKLILKICHDCNYLRHYHSVLIIPFVMTFIEFLQCLHGEAPIETFSNREANTQCNLNNPISCFLSWIIISLFPVMFYCCFDLIV